MKKLLAGIAIAFASFGSYAQTKEPLSLKNIKLGSVVNEESMTTLCNQATLALRGTVRLDGYITCDNSYYSYGSSYGSAVVELPKDGANHIFAGFVFSFDTAEFSSLAKLLTDKFGKPVVVKTPIRTKIGVPYEKITLRWTDANGTMSLSNYGSTVEEGVLIMTSSYQLKQAAKREAESAAKGSKNL